MRAAATKLNRKGKGKGKRKNNTDGKGAAEKSTTKKVFTIRHSAGHDMSVDYPPAEDFSPRGPL